MSGSASRPRVSVHRTARFVHVQLIDDAAGRTLAAVSSQDLKGGSKVEQAEKTGQQLAQAAQKLGVTQAVFDRSGYRYHGRVKAVAEGLRAGGVAV